MALEFERGLISGTEPSIRQSDLLQPSFVKKLVSQGRTPLLMRFENEENFTCFIGPEASGFGQEIEVTPQDAREIAAITQKIVFEH